MTGQVRPIAHRGDEGPIGAVAPPIRDRRAIPPGSVERAGVERGVRRIAGLFRRREEDLGQGVVIAEDRRGEQFLHRFEGLPHARPVPTRATQVRPGVIVAAGSSQVDHPVDTARAAENATARQTVNPVLRPGLRRRVVAPVDVGSPQLEIFGRVADLGAIVRAAGLDQRDRDIRVVRQPACKRASRRPGPDDEVVVAHRRHSGSWPASPQLGIGGCSGSSIQRNWPFTSLSMMSSTSCAAFPTGSPPVSSTQATHCP